MKKAIHNEANWKSALVKSGRESVPVLWYRNAKDNYPPIPVLPILKLMARVSPRIVLGDRDLLAGLWEVATRWEHGDFEDAHYSVQDQIRAVLCTMHEHLGDDYAAFVTE